MFRLIKLIIWIAVISGCVFFWNYKWFSETPIDLEQSVYEIVDGDSFSKILQKETDSKYFAKLYLRNNAPDYPLQKWRYLIEPWQTVEGFLSSLKTPINEDDTVTILEGWTIYDIDDYLDNKWLTEAWEFINNNESYLAEIRDDYPFLESAISLEWFLYPDTYNINPNTFSAKSLSKQMLDNFLVRVYQKLLVNMDGKQMVELVNLASIVERETKDKWLNEREIVAGILKKRYEEDWLIGADATVCYPYKVVYKECTPDFVRNNVQAKNQYNTRTKTGLPKTPIANPSFDSVNAALNPLDTDYYFYLHAADGNIYYWVDNAEHERNRARYNVY